MIKNKCFAKKRRMGYCLLAGLLVALLGRYREWNKQVTRMVTLCGNCVIIVFDLLLLKKVDSL